MSEELHLSVNHRELEIPLLQGGMGVGVSLERLAGSVAACGAMGCISTADCGYREPDFYKNPEEANLRALRQEISDARDISGGRGLLAINAMVATQQFAEAIQTAVASGIDAVISGAGLPLQLPELVPEGSALIAPIVSGGRAAKLILQSWMKKYNRFPDFIVVEGAKAGGHLGFKEDELLADEAPSLAAILKDVLENIRPFVDAAKRNIPVFCAGGVWNREDIQALTEQGAAGVQMATRFIATEECDASQAYKDVLLGANREDVSIIHSPVGMPGRAVQTPLLKKLSLAGRIPPVHCSRCIKKCNPAQVPFCITNALIEAVKGNLETGLFFTGENVGRMKKMTTVPALIKELGY
jgi:oxidoreductase, 2-nitropropane dioxygenase family